MKTDRELLELAAKAAGIQIDRSRLDDPMWRDMLIDISNRDEAGHAIGWNPLTNDGDALRLAVKLRLGISIPPVVDGRVDVVTFYGPIISIIEYPENEDRNAATRRAIVRAAAAIGEGV